MLLALALGMGAVCPQEPAPSPREWQERRPSAAFFAANQGQWDPEILFAVRGDDEDLVLSARGWSWIQRRVGTAPEATETNHPAGRALRWLDEEERRLAPPVRWARIELEPLGAAALQPELVGAPGTQLHYRLGNKADASEVATGASLLSTDLWDGVDLRFVVGEQRVKHQFELDPGVDPAVIRLALRGAEPRLEADGSLVLRSELGEIRDAAPVAWQIDAAGGRQPVEARHALTRTEDGWELSFALDAFDPSLPLIVDPETLVYCGYVGGSDYEELRGLDVTPDGTVWITGHTASTDLPVRGAMQGSFAGGDFDVFVARIDPEGVLRMLTYLGGSDRELAYDLTLDEAGNVYVAGGTNSPDFPTAVGPYLTHDQNLDGFVTKLTPDGVIVYSGFLGGSQFDSIRGNAVDAAGNHYVIGRTVDTEDPLDPPYTFPSEVGPDLTHNGGFSDVFVAKINAAGDDVLYAGFIGGDEIDYGRDVIVDPQGFAYYCGWTNSAEDTFPAIGGPDLSYNGGAENFGANFPQYGDGFIARVLPDGSGYASCGYVGGAGADAVFALRLDGFGGLTFAGHTTSDETTLPVTFGPDLTFNGVPPNEPYGDALVGKLKPGLTEYQFLGYVGGDNQDRAWRMDTDARGRVYLVGNTRSQRDTFPHLGTGPRLNHGGDEDAYLAVVSANGGRVLYGGYFAGSGRETIRDVAVDDAGYVHVAGWSTSPEFPLVKGPNLVKPGSHDGFVARVLPFELLLRAGNAIDPATRERTDMLYVNGQVGDGPERRVFVPFGGGPVTLDIDAIGFDGKPLAESHFVVYVWDGEPTAREASHLVDPFGETIGTSVFPTPLSGNAQSLTKLTTLLNTVGHSGALGIPALPFKKKAPFSIALEITDPGTYTLQALIEDPNKPTDVTLSNAIVLIVQ